MAVDTS
jgi:hypothetical protein